MSTLKFIFTFVHIEECSHWDQKSGPNHKKYKKVPESEFFSQIRFYHWLIGAFSWDCIGENLAIWLSQISTPSEYFSSNIWMEIVSKENKKYKKTTTTHWSNYFGKVTDLKKKLYMYVNCDLDLPNLNYLNYIWILSNWMNLNFVYQNENLSNHL